MLLAIFHGHENENDAKEKNKLAYEYYKRFDNSGNINLQASSAAPIPCVKNKAGPDPVME